MVQTGQFKLCINAKTANRTLAGYKLNAGYCNFQEQKFQH